MKALSLPVNTVVIIIIAVLVLLAAASFFARGFGSGAGTISDAEALGKGCAVWRARGCERTSPGEQIPVIYIEGYNPTGGADKLHTTLKEACIRVVWKGVYPQKETQEENELANACQQYCCGFVG